MKNYLIFRSELLPLSETFILRQSTGLQNYLPYYVGLQKVNGLNLPPEKVITLNSSNHVGLINKNVFKAIGIDLTGNYFRQINRISPYLIHSHFGPDSLIAMHISKQFNIPLIATFHGYDATINKISLRRLISQEVFSWLNRRKFTKKVSTIIGVSEFIKQNLIHKGYPSEKIIVHYIGVDINHFQENQDISREEMILFVGRLIEKKGCKYLIKAMQIVQQKFPNCRLVIIGDGPLKEELEKLSKQLLTCYLFLGYQSIDAVKEHINRAMVVCCPSITASTGDSEGLPTILMESLAMGTPVVASNHAGIPEIITNFENGYLFEEKDVESLAKRIMELITNKEIWGKFHENGRKTIEDKFNLEIQNKKLENLYDQVISYYGNRE